MASAAEQLTDTLIELLTELNRTVAQLRDEIHETTRLITETTTA